MIGKELQMTVYEAIMNRRTIRKFKQDPISYDDLIKLVDCARMAAYGANSQPLKFKIIDDKIIKERVFEHTKWAAMLQDGTPAANERPVAYIAVIGDTDIKKTFEVDAGAAVTNMMLEAEEMGLASCWLGAINREEIKNILNLEDKYQVVYLLALGKPAQSSKAVLMQDSDTRYFLDKDGVLNVPKRSLDEIIL